MDRFQFIELTNGKTVQAVALVDEHGNQITSAGSFIAGSVADYASLPSPASTYTGQVWYVQAGSGGALSALNIYKYPKGFYSPNESDVWELVPFNVKVSEDATTLVNITNWTEYFAYQFEANVGDRIIYNNLAYVNLTGTTTATNPALDTTNWRRDELSNLVTVAAIGGDYTDIVDAITFVKSKTPSTTNRWTIQLAGTGQFTVNNTGGGVRLPEYTSIRSTGDSNTVRLVALDPTEDMFLSANLCFFYGVSFNNITTSGKYVIRIDGDHIVAINRFTFLNCAGGVYINSSGASLEISSGTSTTFLTTIQRVINIQSGFCQADNIAIRDSFSLADTFIEVTGSNSRLDATNIISLTPNLSTGLLIKDGAILNSYGVNLQNMDDGLVVSGSNTDVKINGYSCINAQIDGYRVDNVGTNITASLNAALIEGSGNYNINILNVNSDTYGSGSTELDNINIAEGANIYSFIVDRDINNYPGTNLFGNLIHGTTQNPAKSFFGEGKPYTDNRLGYTFDGTSTYVNVSTNLDSLSGSTVSYPNTSADAAIYIASIVPVSSDTAKHFGFEVKVDTAITLGAGNLIVEYWNGSIWDRVDIMVIESEEPHLTLSEQLFEAVGVFNVNYNVNIDDDWTKNDPMTLGTSYYWTRIRIENAITTSPAIQQLKLHGNFTMFHKTGDQQYFGLYRPTGQLALNFSTGGPFEGNMQAKTLYLSQNVGVGYTNNRFTANGDKIGVAGFFPVDLDTSCPIILILSGRPDTTETISWTIRWAWGTDGDTVHVSEPGAPITNSKSQIISKAATSGQLEYFEAELDVKEMVARRASGFGDQLWISIQPSTMGGNFDLAPSEMTYTKWSEGGHGL